MDLGLTDAAVVVTGASKGIGLAVTRTLLEEGAKVLSVAREPSEALDALVADGHPLRIVLTDLATAAGPLLAVEAAVSAFGTVDVLVNNVGAVRPRPGGFATVDDEQWAWSVNVNLMPAVRTTRAVLPHLVASERGSVVTTCSVNAFLPDPLVIDYSAAKAALAAFSKALSKELGPQGVRVNTVSPGPVATDLWLGPHGVAETVAGATGGDGATLAEQVAAQSVTGRFTTPQEVADLIVLLAGPRLGNLTGADVVIDGGLVPTLH